jgi:hypothetical protein
MRLIFLATAVLAGCAASAPSEPGRYDLSSGDDLTVVRPADDGGLPGDDGGLDLAMRGGLDLAVRDLGSLDAPAGAGDLARIEYGDGGVCGPRVNEVQTSVVTMGNWEFVEIYNPCPAAIDLSGWSLVYRSAGNLSAPNGNDTSTLYTWSTGSIPPGAYRVYGGKDFPGTVDGMLAGSGLADDGAVGLRDAAATLVDSVAYGAVSAGHAFIEGSPAPKPSRLASPGKSISRIPDGYDTNDNSSDFKATDPTPGMTNR